LKSFIRNANFNGMGKEETPPQHCFQAHPWHGISPGTRSPAIVNAFIEIVPTDVVKYELDKESGHLRVDRPQRYSSLCPLPYGFVPRTLCGKQVGELCRCHIADGPSMGDQDPVDICVLTEKTLAHGNVLVTARPIGGLLMIDGDEADDKIVAVLEEDVAYGHLKDISECPPGIIERLRHYFLSYKQLPTESPRRIEIVEVYDRQRALEVIDASFRDYRERYG
jgi:inorganic pyrophosphatase